MQKFETRTVLQEELGRLRRTGKSIALVPTMGNLHAGHLALIRAAIATCDYVLATIFVNPLQFGPTEDLDNYPRTLPEDIEKLTDAGCHGVFIPTVADMYPNGLEKQTLVTVPGLSALHCGASRQGHFDGVCTVVCKLFNLTQADFAFFGDKDYQQLQIIRKMTSDLCMPVKIEGVPTVRQDNGLALSSRNGYLNANELAVAPELHRQLKTTAGKIMAGNDNFNLLQQEAFNTLEKAGLKTEYFSICHARTLAPATTEDIDLVILAAALLGNTRLIDNISVQRRH